MITGGSLEDSKNALDIAESWGNAVKNNNMRIIVIMIMCHNV